MKRLAVVAFAMVLVLTAAVLAGCGEETASITVPEETTVTETTPDTEATTGSEGLPGAMPGAYVDLTPEQAKQLIESTPDLVIIDVSPVYADGHLPGAVSYYGGDGSLAAAIPTLDETAPYLVYCHSDSASIAGAQALVDAGFEVVYRLAGNYAAWVAAGYPVEK